MLVRQTHFSTGGFFKSFVQSCILKCFLPPILYDDARSAFQKRGNFFSDVHLNLFLKDRFIPCTMENFKKSDEYNEAFERAYSTLNAAQKEAVDQIDGAILVVAGPGTGKTQLLAARIGNILRQTDASASSILALTFTDAGAVAMRRRLLEFIGPEAYNVSIYTFHSFCSKVIQENIEYFGGYYDLQPVSELEQVEMIKKIIDGFPDDHELKRFKGNKYYERKPLIDLFSTIKQEGWDIDRIVELAKKEIQTIKTSPDYEYKRKYKDKKAGDKNWGKINKAIKTYTKLMAGVGEFEKYTHFLEKAERFDFNDMILWVIKVFKEKPDLLLQYQERYQYILVDEYQDTNGSQNELLNLLSSFWDDPNLFAVGDDDQSIFRFQGANMDNIMMFKERFNPKVIVLEDNYRSSQPILDSASKLIANNEERLVNQYKEFSKNLKESRNDGLVRLEPVIKVYPNPTQEEIDIANEIIRLHGKEEDLSEVAIIYRKHADVENIVKYLESKGIPLNIKRRLNVLETVEIRRIISILSYLEREGRFLDTASDLLFEILHYEYFDLKPRDIGKISVHCSKRDKDEDRSWDSLLTSKDKLEEIGVSQVDKIMATYDRIQSWISESKNLTLQVLFEKILTQGNIINTIMNSSDRIWRLQVMNTFFDFIKEESVKQPDLNLKNLLDYIDIMQTNDIRLPYEKIISNEDGVNFLTAHASKGLEFKHVYIIKCESKNWEAKRSNNNKFKFPPLLVPASEQSNIEDDRRLFFVAMTRAKDYLTISYAEASDAEKAQEPSRFLPEISNPKDFVKSFVSNEEVLLYKSVLMRNHEAKLDLIDSDLIDRVLEKFSVSVTSLTKYLECPLRFYFENILRVPMARNASMGFGKAMHYALEQLFIKIEENPERKAPPKEDLNTFFAKGMEKTRSHYTLMEYEDLLTYGKMTLEAYYDEYASSWSTPNHSKVEYKVDLTEYEGVPIKGVLDRVDIYQNHVEVVDYKTGKYSNARLKLKAPVGDDDHGGAYWRQIVFYQILLMSDPKMEKPMSVGTMDFLERDEKDEFKKANFTVEQFEIDLVGDQLKQVYQSIKNKEFSEGCNEDDCKWCNFVNDQFAMESNFADYEDEER